MIEEPQLRVLLSVPNGDAWVHKMVNLATIKILGDRRVKTTLIEPTHKPFENNLHLIQADFLAGPYDYWVSMDDDNPPKNNPIDLVLLMDELDLDVVGLPTPVWANMKEGDLPYYWNALDYVPAEEGWKPHMPQSGLQEVDAIGTGCFIVSRKVMADMEAPFMRTWNAKGVVVAGNDYSFCRRAKAKGYRIFAHYDYPCHHFNELDLCEVIEAFNAVMRRGQNS